MNKNIIILLTMILVTICMSYASHAEKTVDVTLGREKIELKIPDGTRIYDEGLVPIRQTADAFNAKLLWDKDVNSLTISSAEAVGVMKIGSRAAWINRSRIHLPYPPTIIDGRAYAPALFFNRMLNMFLVWDPVTQTISWVSSPPLTRGLYGPPPVVYRSLDEDRRYRSEPSSRRTVPVTGTIVGEVVQVRPFDDKAIITVRSNGRISNYRVKQNVLVVRGPISGKVVETPFVNIRPGDRVTMKFNEQKEVISLRAQYKLIRARVISTVDGRITLNTGQILIITPRTRIILPGNYSGEISDIGVGDTVAVSIGPISGSAYVIRVYREWEDTAALKDVVEISPTGILSAGDTLVITFKGSPKGNAKFSIPGIAEKASMTEISLGKYRGEYVIKAGDTLMKQPVTVQFEAADGHRYAVKSARLVTILTKGMYLPRITSPLPRAYINSPVTVEGIAEPGSVIQVTIEYRADVNRLLPLEGTSAIERVLADLDGHWKTRPLPAVYPAYEDLPPIDLNLGPGLEVEEELPIIYIITASRLAPDGEPVASYTIEVTRKPGRQEGG